MKKDLDDSFCSGGIFYENENEVCMEDEDEFVYFCNIETSKLCFIQVYLEFVNISPFLLLRTSKKPYHD